MKLFKVCWLLLLLQGGVLVVQAADAGKAQAMQWMDLLSEQERKLGPPPPLPTNHNFLDEAPGQALAQQLSFTPNPQLEGKLIRLPGYVVPISQDDKGRVTEFFLVPYYGACIHMPPPPPNQVVYSVPAQPFAIKSLTTPYWISGPMKISSKTTRLGAAAYTVSGSSVEPYKD
jgi:hypothetical protein